MTGAQKRQLVLTQKRLSRLSYDFSKLSAESVTNRMSMQSATIMGNIMFGIIVAETGVSSMLDILHDSNQLTNEEAQGCDQKKSKSKRKTRLGNRGLLKKPNNRT